jgi:hypothetical protein
MANFSTGAGPRRPQEPVRLPDKTIIRAEKYQHTDTQVRKAQPKTTAPAHRQGWRQPRTSPVSSACRRRLSLRPTAAAAAPRSRAARCVRGGSRGGASAWPAPEPEEAEEPSVDFVFVSVSSCRDSSFFSFGIAEIERALRAHDVRVLVTGGRLGLEAAA